LKKKKQIEGNLLNVVGQRESLGYEKEKILLFSQREPSYTHYPMEAPPLKSF
jgi:hypothetical protein